MKILILGASGMLGNAIIRELVLNSNWDIYGTIRSDSSRNYFPSNVADKLISGINVENDNSLLELFNSIQPNVVINCVGFIKQLSGSDKPLQVIPINSVLPHRLALISGLIGARLIHFSTDCVFSGLLGGYKESDAPDAQDLYGRSKCLGEVDYHNAITLRTSIIGHELESSRSLIGWFLAQEGVVGGYTNAIFSGFPTIEIARIIRNYVIPRPELHGLYHVSSDPISKYDLLQLVAREYGKKIDIQADDTLVIDRSLDSRRFRDAVGYKPAPWVELVKSMHEFS